MSAFLAGIVGAIVVRLVIAAWRHRRRPPPPVALVQCIGGPMDGDWVPDALGPYRLPPMDAEFPNGRYVRETARDLAALSQAGLESLLALTGDRDFHDELTVYRFVPFGESTLTNPERG